MDCISALKLWMQESFLKLNTDKTEVFLGGPKSFLRKSDITVSINGVLIKPAPVVKDFGVLFDPSLNFDLFLTNNASQTLGHAFNMSRIDYRNSLFTAWLVISQ